MNRLLALFLLALSLGTGGIARAGCPTSYNLTFPPGFTCFAIHLKPPAGNTLDVLFPTAPDFATVYVWTCGKGWDADFFDVLAGGWQANLTLPPGSAAFFFNPDPTSLTYTISGNLPLLGPPPLTPSQCCLYGRFDTCPSTKYGDLTTTPLASGTVIYRWDGSGFVAYMFDFFGDGAWDPSEPVLNVGEGAFICPP